MLLRRLAPWLIVFEVLRAGHDHWGRLDPADRKRVSELMRRTHGNPASLTPADRSELLAIGRSMRLGRLGLLHGHGGGHRAPASPAPGALASVWCRARPHFAPSNGPSSSTPSSWRASTGRS